MFRFIVLVIGLCFILCTSTSCDLITPTTFDDIIMDLPTAQGDTEDDRKPWLIYIEAEINYSILSCLQVDTSEHFFMYWKCLLRCSPACGELRKRIKKNCRTTSENIRHKFSSGIFPGGHMNVSPEQTVAGTISVSAAMCSIFRERVEHGTPTEVVHTFKTDFVLRLNVTFTKFELIDDEMVGLINGHRCKRHPVLSMEDVFRDHFYNCFKVCNFFFLI